MTPPRDPVLGAIWRVGLTELSPSERLVLLTLWRLLGTKQKPIGPGLVAALVGIKRDTARIILRRLRKAGYIAGRGERETGKVTTRWLTDKIQWPTGGRHLGMGVPTSDKAPRYADTQEVGTGVPRNLGTGVPHDYESDMHAAPLAADAAGRASEKTTRPVPF